MNERAQVRTVHKRRRRLMRNITVCGLGAYAPGMLTSAEWEKVTCEKCLSLQKGREDE